MIELTGNRLYQWEVGREITGFDGTHAQFANRGDSTTGFYDVVNGRCEIPSKYLQTGRELIVYDVKVAEATDGTPYIEEILSKTVFPVYDKEKPKPYTPKEAEEAISVVQKLTQQAMEADISAGISAGKAAASAVEADEAAQQAQSIADGVDEMLEGLRTGYNGVKHETAGDAVRNQMANIYSAFDSVPVGNILNPLNGKVGKFADTTVGKPMEEDTLPYTNYYISSNPIPIPSGMKSITVRTSGITSYGDKEGITVYLLDKDKCFVRKYSKYYKSFTDEGITFGTITSECVFMNVQASCVKNGINFSNLCISAKALDSFEKFTDKQDMTVKSSALPDNISALPEIVEGLSETVDDIKNADVGQLGIAPTNGMKMLLFGDSNTETANMNPNGSNYRYTRYNFPVPLCEILQVGDIKDFNRVRNFARHGATCRDTGYQWVGYNSAGSVVLKPQPTYYNEEDSKQWPRENWSWCYEWFPDQETLKNAITNSKAVIDENVVGWKWVPKDGIEYRMNLSEQVDLALRVNGADDATVAAENKWVPNLIIISIGGNDSVAIAKRPKDSQDTYSDALNVTDFNYNTRAKMHTALRYAMLRLRTAYPDAKCFIATPLQRTAFECPRYILDAIPAMAKRYNFIVVDTQSESGIIRETCCPPKWKDPNWESELDDKLQEPYDTYDGLHTTIRGAAKLADLHASVILNTFLSDPYKNKEAK